MATSKSSKKMVLWGLLIMPLVCIIFLRGNLSRNYSWKLPYSCLPIKLQFRSESSHVRGGAFMRFSIRRLVRGQAPRALSQNGISCVSDRQSNFCVTSDPVRIITGGGSVNMYLTAGQHLQGVEKERFAAVQPYPRKTDRDAMQRTGRVNIIHVHPYGSGGREEVPACDVLHSVPAVVFSTGGYAGNFFHDVSDMLIPLFLTAGHFRSRVQIVVTDYEPWWFNKFRKFFDRLSAHDIIVASSNSTAVNPAVHCFPGAVLGLTVHGFLHCNSTLPPGGASTHDFMGFLREAYSLPNSHVNPADETRRPILVLLSRDKSRALLNEREVVALAEQVGFSVKVASPDMAKHLGDFSLLVNSCGVLMGVHGAGLTHMVFMPAGAVVLQIVPWGLEWVSETYFGRDRVAELGLHYVEYKAAAEESTLYGEYPKNHPVITNPLAVHQQGYLVSRPIYTDGQNLTVDVSRLRGRLLEALRLLQTRALPTTHSDVHP